MDLLDLYATLSLDSSEYEDGLSDAEGKASSFGEKIGSGLKSAGSVAGTALAGIAGAAVTVGSALLDNAKKTAEYGDTIDKNSQKMGISAKAYQEWDAVLQHSGTSMTSMSGGFKKLATAAQSSSKAQVAAFKAIGLSMEEVRSMSTEELWASTIYGLQGMESGTERTAVASALLGGSAKELGALLNTSAEDTQGMIDKVNELGGVMSDDAVKASASFQDNLQDLSTGLASIGYQLGTAIMPLLNDFMTFAIEQLPAIKETLSEIFGGADVVLESIGTVAFTVFDAVKSGIESVMEVVGENGVTWSEVWAGCSEALLTAGSFIVSVINMISAGIRALVIEAQTDGSIINVIWTTLQTVFSNVASVITTAVETLTALFNGDFSTALSGLGTLFGDVITGIGDGFGGLVTVFGTVFQTILDSCGGWVSSLGDAITSGISGVIDTIGGFIGGIVDFFTGGDDGAEAATESYTTAASNISDSTATASTEVATNMSSISTTMSTEASTQQETVSTAYETMTTDVKTAMENQGKAITEGQSKIEEDLTTSMTNINTNTETGLTTFTGKWTSAMSSVVSTVTTAMTSVAGLLNKSYTVNVSVANSATGTTETFAKAMGHAYVLNGATTFGVMGDKKLVGGEAGQEMVVGTGTLMGAIAQASGGAQTVNAIAAYGDQIIRVLGQYLPNVGKSNIYLDGNTLVGGIVDQMDDALGQKWQMSQRGALA